MAKLYEIMLALEAHEAGRRLGKARQEGRPACSRRVDALAGLAGLAMFALLVWLLWLALFG